MPSSKYYKVEELNPDLLYNIELDPKDMAAGQKAIAALETHATNITVR